MDNMNQDQMINENNMQQGNQDNIDAQARLDARQALDEARQVAADLQRIRQAFALGEGANQRNIARGQAENMPQEEGMDPEVDVGGRRNKMSMRQKFMNRMSMLNQSMRKRYRSTKRKMSMRKKPKRKSRRL
jgi:hypothetical protein